jgi:hypothetical protein
MEDNAAPRKYLDEPYIVKEIAFVAKASVSVGRLSTDKAATIEVNFMVRDVKCEMRR